MVIASKSLKTLWIPSIGIPIGGVLWSVAAFVMNKGQVSDAGLGMPSTFFLVLAGGMAQTIVAWVSFSAILWAMVRGFGQALTLLQVLRLLSGASWPLWIGAPAIAVWIAGSEQQTTLAVLISLTCLSAAFTLTTQALANETAWSTLRAFSALSAAVIFLSSFFYLSV